MERLTTHTKTVVTKEVAEIFGFDEGIHEAIEISKCGNETCAETCDRVDGCEKCPIKEAIDKLADYEDAEEKGLLHRTKVAIGQTVYTDFAMRGWYLREAAKPYKTKVVFIGLSDSKEDGGGFFNVAYEKLGCMMQFRFSDIGKSVFLTKEEAALQKMQEGEA